MEHPSLMQSLNYPELKRKMPFCVRENKAQARNGVKRISRIRIDKMTFKKEIRIPIKNSNLCVCMHNMTDVILQFEVFIAFIEGSFTLYHSCSKILVFSI